jgi:hypothetical protein
MSNIVLQPNSSGTGSITIASPNTNTNRTLNIPDVAGNIVTTGDSGTIASSMIANDAVGNAQLAAGHGGFKSMQVFTSTGTYTKPTGIKTIKVIATGGGGGGYSGSPSYNSGGGGGAGATCIKVIDVTSISSISVTIGAAGSGGTGDNYNNASGGSTSFGSHCTAGGGERGFREDQKTGTLGVGGIPTGGDINIHGGMGASGGGGSATDEPPGGGVGGASYWGGAGTNGNNSLAAVNSTVYGAGGSGADHNGSSSANGGNGVAGIVVVEEYA